MSEFAAETLSIIIDNHKTALCIDIIEMLDRKYPKMKYDTEKCLTGVLLLLQAISNDKHHKNGINTIDAALSYSYRYNDLKYKEQKEKQLFVIATLKRKLLKLANRDEDVAKLIKLRFKVIKDVVSSQILREVNVWGILAQSVPFFILVILSGLHFANLTPVYNHLMLISVITFVIGAFIWWWWAIWRIAHVVVSIQQMRSTFAEVKMALSSTRFL